MSRFEIRSEHPGQEVLLFEGGETKALELCKKRIENERESFKIGKINPNLNKPILFTKEVSLSPYLRFGCLSVRKLYWELRKSFLKVRIKLSRFKFSWQILMLLIINFKGV